ncbi:MAG: hypothetical protein NC489_20935 [Ruminococcus flavefaciens]|nr:hypothetical protein [Ruminococcus flavefaciens]
MVNYDDCNDQYHTQCIGCDVVYYISYNEMVHDGWRVAYHKGYVCPCCTKKFRDAVTLPVAQENRQKNQWSSLVNP